MADEEKSKRLPTEVLVAIIAGTFGLLTVLLTQWEEMPWVEDGPEEIAPPEKGNIAAVEAGPAAGNNLTGTPGPGGVDRAGEPGTQMTRAFPGYRDAPAADSAPGRLRLYARAVGRLSVDGAPRCTAFLVSENLALTASFCIPDEGGAVTVQFDQGTPPVTARLVESSGLVQAAGTGVPDEITYAVLSLEGNPGAERGWLPLTSASPGAGGELAVIGGAVERNIVNGCRTQGVHSNVIEHNCDPGAGGAGAPIIAADASRVIGLYAFGRPGQKWAVRGDRLLERSRRLQSLTD